MRAKLAMATSAFMRLPVRHATVRNCHGETHLQNRDAQHVSAHALHSPYSKKNKANLPKMVKRIRGTEGLSCPCSSTPVTWQA